MAEILLKRNIRLMIAKIGMVIFVTLLTQSSTQSIIAHDINDTDSSEEKLLADEDRGIENYVKDTKGYEINENLRRIGDLEFDWSGFKEPTYINVSYDKKIPNLHAPLIAGDIIIVTEFDGTIKAISITKKKKLWTNTSFKDISSVTSSLHPIYGGIALHKNKLYATCGYNKMIAIDVNTGETVWSKQMISSTRNVPLIYNDNIIVHSSNGDATVIDSENGHTLKVYPYYLNLPTSDDVRTIGESRIALFDNRIFIQNGEGNLTLISMKDGEDAKIAFIQNIENEGNQNISSTGAESEMTIYNEVLFSLSKSGTILALDLTRDKVVWKTKAAISGKMWIENNTIYALNIRKDLVAIDCNTGKVKWINKILSKNKRNTNTYTSPVLIGGKVSILSSSGNILLFSSDGNYIRSHKIPKGIYLDPIVKDGKMYFIRDTGQILIY